MQQYSEKMSIFAEVKRFFTIVEVCCLAKNRMTISRIQYVLLDN
jgi:hypothetical protein